MTRLAAILLVCAGFLFASCGGSEPQAPESAATAQAQPAAEDSLEPPPPPIPSGTLAFGNVTARGAPIDAVLLYQEHWIRIDPLGLPAVVEVDREGNFFVLNLKPGRYYLNSLRSGGQWYNLTYDTEEELSAAARAVLRDAVAYLGSYKIFDLQRALPGGGGFTVQTTGIPTQHQILERVADDIGDEGWAYKIRLHLDGLP